MLDLLKPADASASRSDEATVVLSALSGLAGIGKSALARAAALFAASHGWFTGGVIWVDMHGYDADNLSVIRPDQMWSALLSALGVTAEDIPVAEEARATAYHQHLAGLANEGRNVLLVLDNVSSASQVKPLLPLFGRQAMQHRVLLTSRQTLAELPAQLLSLNVLDTAAASMLLSTTLTTRRPGDRRVEDDPDACMQLLEVCAGLPLAVVIVGAILAAEPSLTVTELTAELNDASSRLSGLAIGPELAVDKAFELSYRRLDDDQRAVFAAFSATPGAYVSLDVVAAAANLSLARVRAAVRGLEGAHLLEPVLVVGPPRRWRMHDLVRLFASAKLDAGAQVDVFGRVLVYYMSRADAAWRRVALGADSANEIRFSTLHEALDWVISERAGLVESVAKAEDSHAHDAVLLAADLFPCFQRLNLVDDALLVATAAVRLASSRSETSDRDRAVASGNLGVALLQSGRPEEAIPAMQRARALFARIGDHHAEAVTLMNLGIVHVHLKRHEEAKQTLEMARAALRDLRDPMIEASVTLNMGNALLAAGELNEAITTLTSAQELFKTLGDSHGVGQAWGSIGSTYRQMGRQVEAIDAYRNACVALNESGDQSSEATAHGHLGDALAASGHFADAASAFAQSVALHLASGDPKGASFAAIRLAAASGGRQFRTES